MLIAAGALAVGAGVVPSVLRQPRTGAAILPGAADARLASDAAASPRRGAVVDLPGLEHANLRIACATCHDTREPNPLNAAAADLYLFHQGLVVRHGALTCLSCHNPSDYGTLRLAGGASVAFEASATLCAQCHAPQAADYERGLHGGMTGYWDTSRGERLRKSCIDCHDPHAPAMPAMRPTFKPIDRFLPPREEHR